MKAKIILSKTGILFCMLGLLTLSLDAQIFKENTYYKLTNEWQGDAMSLDITNDGNNNTPIMAKSGDFSGQRWRIKKVGIQKYILSTEWQGSDMTLECLSGSNSISPKLTSKNNNLGGTWYIKPLGKGYFRITNVWLNKSLDVVNEGDNTEIEVRKTEDVSGQFWKITPVSKVLGNSDSPVVSGSDNITLKAGQLLKRGASIVCPNRAYRCTFQKDGNLVIYNNSNNTAVWASGTDGKGSTCKLQKDGNFVIYTKYGKACWNSNTASTSSSTKATSFTLNNNGVCELKTNSGKSVWEEGNPAFVIKTSDTWHPPTSSSLIYVLKAGETMVKGTTVSCSNRNYNLKFQKDGNLAYYGPNDKYLWDAKTNGKGETCTLQKDGNFVVYDKNNNAVWSTETMAYFNSKYGSTSHKPVKLEISNSGVCGLKSATGRVVWTCN